MRASASSARGAPVARQEAPRAPSGGALQPGADPPGAKPREESGARGRELRPREGCAVP